MKFLLALFFSLSIFCGQAQFLLSGTVIDGFTKKPVAGASVFINNATKGTVTTEAGKFVINNLNSGNFELVISIIGYETFLKSLASTKQIESQVFELAPKAVKLKEVNIYPKSVRARYMSVFVSNFIGLSENAFQCKILNQDIIDFHYDKQKDELEASTDDFLIIENKALGYRIKFLLTTFLLNDFNKFSHRTYYEGSAFFDEMIGGKSQKKIWIRNRRNTYEGSNMHFFRSAAFGLIRQYGFILHRLIRKPNENRPSDEAIRRKLDYFLSAKSASSADSIGYWNRKMDLPKVIQYLNSDTLSEQSIIKRTDKPNVFALSFKDMVYVSYTKGTSNLAKTQNVLFAIPNAPYSIMQLTEQYTFFDNNGIVLNPQSLLFEGYWADHGKISNLLPIDF